MYSLHRIIGIRKVDEKIEDNRFSLVRKFKSHLHVYAIVAFLGSVFSFLFLSKEIKLLLIAPSLISLLYVLPIFIKNKRLRDFNYIKIFLVSISWAILCATIPAYQSSVLPLDHFLIFLEKAFFIFAITLPFDYRDRKVDQLNQVKTLAHLFEQKIHLFIIACFGLTIGITFLVQSYSFSIKVCLALSYIIIGLISLVVYKKDNDFYISGILDGTMILLFISTILHHIISQLPISYIL